MTRKSLPQFSPSPSFFLNPNLLLTTLLLLPFLLSLTLSQLTLPTCANDCLITYARNTTCSISNYTCLCKDQTLVNNLATCVQANCPAETVIDVEGETIRACKSAGVNINLPPVTTFNSAATTATSTRTSTLTTSTASSSPTLTGDNSYISKTPIGAIVGASVGGFVAVILGVWGILYELNRRKRHDYEQELARLQHGGIEEEIGPQPIAFNGQEQVGNSNDLPVPPPEGYGGDSGSTGYANAAFSEGNKKKKKFLLF